MQTLIDRLLILAVCLLLIPVNRGFSAALAGLIIAVIISEINIIYHHKWVTAGLTCGYLIACFFYPQFFVFLPLLLYDAVWNRYYWLIAAIGAAQLYDFSQIEIKELLFLAVIDFTVCYLSNRTRHLVILKEELLELRDTSKELEIVMKEKNHELLLNQDNEIHLATLQERNRIAREIHDNVGHMLSRAILMVGAIKAMNQNNALDDSIMSLKETLSNAMTAIRSSVHDLHDEAIDMKETMQQLITEFQFCPITMDYDMSSHVDRNVKLAFIAITKEACSNIIKHSNASKVEVIAREHPGIYQLLIKDNGTKVTLNKENGIGLGNMEDRVKALNGTISFDSENGFKIFVMIPKHNK